MKISMNNCKFLVSKFPDEKFLLAFLRTKKYSLDQATKTFEYHSIYRHRYPHWFDSSTGAVNRMRHLIDDGCAYTLLERTAEGQMVILINNRRFDVDKYTEDDIFNFVYFLSILLVMDENTQFTGCVYLLNYEGITMKFMSMFPLDNALNYAKYITHAAPGRFKKVYFCGMPSFVQFLLKAAKLVISEKLKARLMVIGDLNGLEDDFDRKLLPAEFGGGDIPEEVYIENFHKIFDEHLDEISAINDFEIDASKIPKGSEFHEPVASFRKLEID